MGKPNESVLRAILFSQELDISLKLIKSGLAHLQHNALYQQKHFIYLILLSGGIERLEKIVLYLRVLETEGRYLTEKELRGWGHDLEALTDEIVQRCFVSPYIQRAFASDDLKFLTHDPNFRRMLELLTKFAKRDRYIYMDGLAEPTLFRESPEALWEEFQKETLPANDTPDFSDEQAVREYVQKLNRSAVIYTEKLMRALARLFIFGILGSQGKQFSSYVKDFSEWGDDRLGTKVYEF